MDVKIIPEALPEPTFSGTIFQRQTMIRWTQPVGSSFFIHVAAEDPSSDDVFADDPDPNFFNTKYPDSVLGLEYVHGARGHVRLNSLVRYLEVDLPAGGGTTDKTGWGFMLSSSIRVFEQDRVSFGGTYGKGVGRYLLGIPATAGARIKPAGDSLDLNENWGAFLSYKHYWLDHLRSSAYGGYAKAEQSGSGPARPSRAASTGRPT
jgi:hypothetical protein